MKRVRISDLHPGMKTAEDVFSYNNQMIVPKGSVLDDKMITRLEFYSVLAVRIADEEDGEEDVPSAAESGSDEDTAYSVKVKNSKQFKRFEQSFLENTENFKVKLKDIAESGGEIDSRELIDSITGLIAEDMTGLSVFDMLHNMRQYDDLTYMHSMNVALICNVFGKWLGMSPADIDIITLGGLLHDIGKLKIPDNIIRKPDKLSPAEYNIIKTHPWQGYNIVKDKNIDDNV